MNRASFLRRLSLVPVTLLGVAVVVFVLLRIIPGDPVALMAAPGSSAEELARLRVVYGLDKSLPLQFFSWFVDLLRGHLGTSISFHEDVVSLVVERMPATLELVALAMIIAVMLGTGLALFGAYFRDRAPEWGVDGLVAYMVAMPDFLWSLFFILVFHVMFPILPGSGRVDPALELPFHSGFYMIESLLTWRFDLLGMLLAHAILPAITLALPFAAMLARVLKASLAEAEEQDYAWMARARGFGRIRVLVKEALPNAVIPAASLTAVQLTFLFSGTVLVERIFSYPGIGNLSVDALSNRDLPLVQAIILAFAVLYVVINLAFDLAIVGLNPRLRHG